MNETLPLSTARAPRYVTLNDQDGSDLSSMMGIFVRRLPLVLAIPLIATAIAMTIFFLLTPRYTSTVSLLIDPKRPGSLGPDGEFASILVDSIKINSVVSVIQSASLLERVVRAENLINDAEFARPPLRLLYYVLELVWLSTPSESVAGTDDLTTASADRLRQSVSVVRDGLTYVIQIGVTTSDAQKSARLAKALAEAYLNEQLEAKYDSARRATNWLASRLSELRAELISSEEAVESVRRTYGLTETDRGISSTVGRAQITELNNQVIAAQGMLTSKQTTYEQAVRLQKSGGTLDAMPEVVTSSVIVQLRTQQSDAARRLADAVQRFGPRHPDVLRGEEEKRAVDRQVGAEITRVVNNLKNDFDNSAKRTESLKSQMAALVGEGGAINPAGQGKLREAQRVAEANKHLYDTFLNRFKESEQKQTLQEAEARVISTARVPSVASFPRIGVFLFISLGLGTLVGIGVAVAAEQLDHTFSTSSQAERLLGVPVIASVPLIKPGAAMADGGWLQIVDYVEAKPFSRFAETLRNIRVGLKMSDVDHPPRVVQFTSTVPAEGKSTLAAAVALSSAQSGVRTLIIDCDFRHPSTLKQFKLDGSTGLIDLLLGNASWHHAAVKYPNLPLTLLPAGSAGIESPPDLVNSQRLRDIIGTLARDYDLVILDSPPIHAVSDALVLGDIADATVFVIEWKRTSRAMAAQALNQLRISHGKIGGIVINKVDFSRLQAHGYGYGYGYGKYRKSTNKYYAN